MYTLLRGKDVETGRPDPERREAQFAVLQHAHDKVLDLTNWHEFLHCLERAGFRGAKMISSDNALLFSYALWLLGRIDYHVPLDRLREVIARWFFMAHTTGRYTGAFESRFEQDASRLSDLAPGDADGYIRVLSEIVDNTLTADYWSITLPNELATSASKSPALLAYIAALNILDADALLSTGKVRSRLDPAVTAKKGIERHHIFPKAYDMLSRQRYWHALPDGWEEMDYPAFLAARRRLMGHVVRDAYAKLNEHGYTPVYLKAGQAPAGQPDAARSWTHHGVRLSDLISADLLPAGTMLLPAQGATDEVATVLPDGKIAYASELYNTPSAASGAASGASTNGWTYWTADTPDGRFSLAAIRDEFLARRQ